MDLTFDMHIHSRYSADGEFSPTTLVEMCKNSNISTMAITDHNTVSGVEEGLIAAKNNNITLVPGVELDCVFKGIEFHVLAYEIDYLSPDFADIEQNVRDQSNRYSRELKNRISEKLGLDVSDDDMKKQVADSTWSIWTGEDFCSVLLGYEQYKDNKILAPYRPGGSRSDNPALNFYWDYCSQGKPCYVVIDYPPIEETLNTIHSNGGYAVLAHPGNNLKGNFELIDEMLPLGIAGIEVYSSYHDPATTQWFYDKAIEKGVTISRGSDFHGKTKPAISLGQDFSK